MSLAIYNDSSEWQIVDATDDGRSREWHPMNGPAKHLCRCLEGVHDVQEQIEHVFTAQNRAKRRRRLRSLVVPLHSLCIATVDLLNCIASDKTIAERLPRTAGSDIAQLLAFVRAHVPFGRGEKLTALRNKIAAHYDRDLQPSDSRQLNASIELTEVAEWISVLISVLCDVLKLNVFMWSGTGYAEGGVMIMCTDPLMTDFQVEDGQVVAINGAYITKSPRWCAYAALKTLWLVSDRMFERSSRWRIKEFVEDAPGDHWSKVVRNFSHRRRGED
ncbi:MAG: hypothetical protein JO354_07780 [Verrucomicrobia bacterium]|nr:hypothetical protein [Verrucomicrobiota bacterium]